MASRHRHFHVDTPQVDYQNDRTLIDVIVVDSVHGKPIERPWMTLVVDVATRKVAGYCVSRELPSLPGSSSGRGGDIEQLPD